MSLAITSYAALNIPSLGHHLVSRQTTAQYNSLPSDAPDFTCKLRKDYPANRLETDSRLIPLCSSHAFVQPILACQTPNGHVITNLTAEHRDGCVDHCNKVADGTFVKNLSDCWDKACEDGKENREKNQKLWEYIRDENHKILCEPLGLMGDDKVSGTTTTIDESDTSDSALPNLPTLPKVDLFKCTIRKENPSYREDGRLALPTCDQPEIRDPDDKCRMPDGKNIETPPTNRDACVDYCNLLHNGTFVESVWKCWDEACEDASDPENKELNEKYFENIRKNSIRSFCEPLGLKGNDVEGAAAKEDAGSAASGFGVKKGVVVLALVFGSLFSGLMV